MGKAAKEGCDSYNGLLAGVKSHGRTGLYVEKVEFVACDTNAIGELEEVAL